MVEFDVKGPKKGLYALKPTNQQTNHKEAAKKKKKKRQHIMHKIPTLPHFKCLAAQSAGTKEDAGCIFPEKEYSHPSSVPNMTLSYLIARIRSWSFEECGVSLHYHYSQVHSDPE